MRIAPTTFFAAILCFSAGEAYSQLLPRIQRLERKLLNGNDPRQGFQLVFDPVSAQATLDGHAVQSYCNVDLLLDYGVPYEVRVYGGLGLGYIAPRARFGVDLFPNDWSFIRFGTRASVVRDVDEKFWLALDAEVGLALRAVFKRHRALSILASYLIGPGFILDGSRGAALLQGGSLSLTVEL